MGELLQVQNNGTSDHQYMEVLGEQREQLETSFEIALSTIDEIIQFYSLNPEDEGVKEKFIEIIRKLSIDPNKISKIISKIYRLEKQFQGLYKHQLKILEELNLSSFDKISVNLEVLYDQSLKTGEIQSLEKSLDNLKPIELESSNVVLDLDLSKEQLLKLLQIEKDKRVSLTLLNDKVFEPKIKSLENDFDKWNVRDKELKSFLIDDLEAINKKVQNVKKVESLEL